ncbi:hypothetical protein [Sagittula sp. MA-2]|uniref:hypothetical protein n=1 Tax=Sagittula sp. MA-2 TaxID=3048007 RepID=UPI0024C4388C|nr:hypothetical protein [Sagittula sp. MA-2]WHZ34368.1 hypothetical protein QNI11_17245 [Sagittula sp. MA-2]
MTYEAEDPYLKMHRDRTETYGRDDPALVQTRRKGVWSIAGLVAGVVLVIAVALTVFLGPSATTTPVDPAAQETAVPVDPDSGAPAADAPAASEMTAEPSSEAAPAAPAAPEASDGGATTTPLQ